MRLCVAMGGRLAAAGWAMLPDATRAEVAARLAATGGLRCVDAALRLVVQYGTAARSVLIALSVGSNGTS